MLINNSQKLAPSKVDNIVEMELGELLEDSVKRAVEGHCKSPMRDQQMGASSETLELSQGRSSDEVDGSARCCSANGCKAVIPGKQYFILFSCYHMLIYLASCEYRT